MADWTGICWFCSGSLSSELSCIAQRPPLQIIGVTVLAITIDVDGDGILRWWVKKRGSDEAMNVPRILLPSTIDRDHGESCAWVELLLDDSTGVDVTNTTVIADLVIVEPFDEGPLLHATSLRLPPKNFCLEKLS